LLHVANVVHRRSAATPGTDETYSNEPARHNDRLNATHSIYPMLDRGRTSTKRLVWASVAPYLWWAR
jgi:hypothetical protein